jgi:hypothetical protein
MDAAISRSATSCRSRRWTCADACGAEPVWDLNIVAGQILARKGIAPDAETSDFVTEGSPFSTAGPWPVSHWN